MVVSNFFPNEPKTWIKENQDKVGILIMRYLLGFVWLSQGMAKIIFRQPNNPYGDHNGFLGNLVSMADTNPITFVSEIILRGIIIPNNEIFLVLVILTELTIATSLIFGLFTRLGSTIGGLMTITLWIFTLGWGEWIWTYPLIFFPHVLFFLAGSGRDIGIDRMIVNKISDDSFVNLLT